MERSHWEHPDSAPCCECSSMLFQRLHRLDRAALICISKSKQNRNCYAMYFQTQNNSFLSPLTGHNMINHQFFQLRPHEGFLYLTVYCLSPLTRFLLQSLEDLDSSLRKLNSRLFVIRGQPTDVFPRLFKVIQSSDYLIFFFIFFFYIFESKCFKSEK